MKDTGIVRRIDDLGRIVIPKEIRKSLFLKEGTALEIQTTDEGGIVLKKHDVLKTISDIASAFCEVIYSCLQFPTLVTDTNTVLASEGVSKKTYLHKTLSNDVKSMIMESQNYMASAKNKTTLYPIVEDEQIKFVSQIIIPIIYDGVCEGTIILLGFDKDNDYSNVDIKVLQTLSCIMSKLLG